VSRYMVTIGELVDAGEADIQTGPFGTQLKASDYVHEGTPVINVRNIGFGTLKPEKLEYVSEETTDRLAAHLLQPGDIVFGRKGAVDRHLLVSQGQTAWMQGSDCIRLRFTTDKVVPRFASYNFLTQTHQQWMLSQSGNKATMASLNHDVIRRIAFRLLSRTEQQRIADLLTSYDDLIENNHRRMDLLEEAARQLYCEWFIRLHFPGHEHTPVVNRIPEGWGTHILDNLCTVGRGASPRPIADFMGGEVPWFKIGDATASESIFILDTEERVTHDGAIKSVFVEPGDLVLSNSATCGVPYFAGIRGCVHDGWLHFSDLRRISRPFLYCYLYFKQEELVSSVGDGSTQKNLNTTAVGRLLIVIPETDTLLRQFDDAVEPMYKLIFTLAKQNRKLRVARDLLLPRLMSGEISVSS